MLQIEILGCHLEVTDTLRAYVEDRVMRLLRQCSGVEITSFKVTLFGGKEQKVIFVLKLPRCDGIVLDQDVYKPGNPLASGMYGAIDIATKRLFRLIQEHKSFHASKYNKPVVLEDGFFISSFSPEDNIPSSETTFAVFQHEAPFVA